MIGAETAVDPAVRVWLDKNELTELVARLSSAVDRQDREAIEACYAEQSYDDHGAFGGSGREFAEYITTQQPGQGARPAMHHLLGQSIFEVEGDEAWGETFFVFHSHTDTALYPAIGRYIDYFARIDGEWRLVYRRVLAEWLGAHDVARSSNVANYVRAAWDRTDPKYDRLRWPTD